MLVVIVLGVGCGVYIADYYHADEQAIIAATQSTNRVTVSEEGKNLVFAPEDPVAGFIFYPGGKVQYEAYSPLVQKCAENGILCVLVHMPGNLAVLDMNAADGIQEKYPEIETWYIGGHSLGGAMAASYVAECTDMYQGLILLAAYSTRDLRNSGLDVLSVYGSEDHVLDREAYDENKKNLPQDYRECIIEGGCHAYFGSYGFQDGDGTPTITNEEQTEQTAGMIVDLIIN